MLQETDMAPRVATAVTLGVTVITGPAVTVTVADATGLVQPGPEQDTV
jgi:hypothetical protein